MPKDIAGGYIKCKYCQYEHAYIALEERRYMVNCPQCGSHYLLKEQHK